MKSATLGDAPYQVPRENKRWPAIGLAVAMHAGLFAMLWIGVHWQNDQPIAVEAEVWDMKVQSAAPPPPPPVEAPQSEPTPPPAPVQPPPPVAPPVEAPPQPNPVDIALEKKKAKLKAEQEQKAEQARQQKLEDEAQAKADKLAKAAKDKADAKAKALAEQKAQDEADAKAEKAAEKAAAEKKAALDKADKADKAKRAAAESKKADDARKAEMARILGATGTSGTAAKSTAPRQDSGYVAAITAKIKGNIAYSGSTDAPGNPRAVYKITQLPTGEIISVRKVKSSGVPAFDSAVENAISKSSPLPKKKDGTVERDIDAIFDMKDTP